MNAEDPSCAIASARRTFRREGQMVVTTSDCRVTDAQYDTLRRRVHRFIDEKCIVRNRVMPGRRPGTRYTWMFYLRRGLFNHEFLSSVARMFIYKMERIDPALDFQISGLETAATPMLAGIPLVARGLGADINAFVVRRDRKEYGLRNMFEGIPNQKLCVIVDDLCNSSRSMGLCFERLGDAGVSVADVAFAIVNKSNRRVHSEARRKTDMYLPREVRVVSLFTLDDFGLTNPSH